MNSKKYNFNRVIMETGDNYDFNEENNDYDPYID